MWRLDSGARTFLPRLQGALTAISPAPSDPACYIVTQADNTIRMVSGPASGSCAPLRASCHAAPCRGSVFASCIPLAVASCMLAPALALPQLVMS